MIAEASVAHQAPNKFVNMKSMILVALALVAVAAAIPVEKEPTTIVRNEFDQKPEGGYSLNVETDDGTARQEEAKLKEVLNEKNELQNVLIVRGSFSYIDPEGNVQKVTYVADEQGFRADGPSIPKDA